MRRISKSIVISPIITIRILLPQFFEEGDRGEKLFLKSFSPGFSPSLYHVFLDHCPFGVSGGVGERGLGDSGQRLGGQKSLV